MVGCRKGGCLIRLISPLGMGGRMERSRAILWRLITVYIVEIDTCMRDQNRISKSCDFHKMGTFGSGSEEDY